MVMANKTREGGDVTLTEASLGEAIKRRNRIQLVNGQEPIHCLVKDKKIAHIIYLNIDFV